MIIFIKWAGRFLTVAGFVPFPGIAEWLVAGATTVQRFHSSFYRPLAQWGFDPRNARNEVQSLNHRGQHTFVLSLICISYQGQGSVVGSGGTDEPNISIRVNDTELNTVATHRYTSTLDTLKNWTDDHSGKEYPSALKKTVWRTLIYFRLSITTSTVPTFSDWDALVRETIGLGEMMLLHQT